MEHKNLSLEYDKNLIEKILDDTDMRYIVLFLYIIRNDLFKDLSDKNIIDAYEKILILDEINKSNIKRLWQKEFIELAIDLGLFKNIRSLREFNQKEDDFILKLGEETITIENNTISIPDDVLFLIINKKFKSLNRRNFNLALIKLKSVKCESANVIHSFIYEIGEHDFTLSDDLYYILDQYGNIYQTIKIEITIEGFYERFKEIKTTIDEILHIFDPIFSKKSVLAKVYEAIEKNKDIISFLKEQKLELPDKFKFEKIDKKDEIFIKWKSHLINLLQFKCKLREIDKKIREIKKIYSGKERKYPYLQFIEKISYNEENIIDQIQDKLLKLREDLIKINNYISKTSKKKLKLLNLDYEKLIIISTDD